MVVAAEACEDETEVTADAEVEVPVVEAVTDEELPVVGVAEPVEEPPTELRLALVPVTSWQISWEIFRVAAQVDTG